MNNKEEASKRGDDDAKYAQVPVDFPQPLHHGAVSGAQPKFLAVHYKGRYYSLGCPLPKLTSTGISVKTLPSSSFRNFLLRTSTA